MQRGQYENRVISRVAALTGFVAESHGDTVRLVNAELHSHIVVYLDADGVPVRASKCDVDGTVGTGYRVNADGVAVGSGDADGVALMVVAWMSDAEQLAADAAQTN